MSSELEIVMRVYFEKAPNDCWLEGLDQRPPARWEF